MLHKRFRFCTVILLVLGLTGLQAQESMNASGGNASGAGGSVNYSTGQVVYTTNTGTNGSVAQGVQQPYEIFVVTAVEETEGMALSVSVYPNPTAGLLQLKVENEMLKDLSYQLFDVDGQLLQDQKIINNPTNIAMSHLAPSTYFIKVIQGNKEVKTFKIIKK